MVQECEFSDYMYCDIIIQWRRNSRGSGLGPPLFKGLITRSHVHGYAIDNAILSMDMQCGLSADWKNNYMAFPEMLASRNG